MQAVSGVATGHEGVGGVIHSALGIRENYGKARGFNVDDAAEHFQLGTALHFVVALLHGGHGQRLLLNGDSRGVGRVVLNEAADARLKGGGEEDGLTLFRHGGHQAVDVVAEAHVEHFIRLIKDERFEGVELQQSALHEVKDTAGRADHDLGAALQSADLTVIRSAAVDRCGAHAFFEGGQLVDLRADLHGQLAGGAKDQGLHSALGAIDALHHGNAKGHGFTGAGLALAHDIPSGKGHRNGFSLDG